jgi:hypothetical protein
MESGTLTIRGDRVGELLSAVAGPRGSMERTRYRAERFCVVARERWDSWRTGTDLVAVVATELPDEETCQVAVLAGGGGSGLTGRDWTATSVAAEHLLGAEQSAEAAAFEEAVVDVEEACEEPDLTLEVGDDAG